MFKGEQAGNQKSRQISEVEANLFYIENSRKARAKLETHLNTKTKTKTKQ